VIPDLLLPAPAVTPDIATSVDGFTLFEEGTATAKSGIGDVAVAFGNNSDAKAGAGSEAHAGGTSLNFSSFDSASGAGIGGAGLQSRGRCYRKLFRPYRRRRGHD
jgi:hypothetical protein